uniref:Uncharacterized protein n=1 Tax=Syphacia muris TaxID=451379 RepID=A0A0N5AAU3_9BILA
MRRVRGGVVSGHGVEQHRGWWQNDQRQQQFSAFSIHFPELFRCQHVSSYSDDDDDELRRRRRLATTATEKLWIGNDVSSVASASSLVCFAVAILCLVPPPPPPPPPPPSASATAAASHLCFSRLLH